MLCRFSFLWAGKRRPKIRTLTLTMRQRPCRVPGPHFKVHAPGDSFTFRHPVSGTDYTLQVQELAQETLPRGLLTAFYPTHFTAMRDAALRRLPQQQEPAAAGLQHEDSPAAQRGRTFFHAGQRAIERD